MAVSYPTKIFLAMKSGDRCALRDCRAALTSIGIKSGPTVLGEAAHIYGEKEYSARYRKDMTKEQRNHYDNLIYLCSGCHTKIDKQENDYPAELLFKIKSYHEEWVAQQLDEAMSAVSFAELEVATKVIATGHYSNNVDFYVITPEEKIKKNGLSISVRALISTGLSRSSEVTEYLAKQAQIDDGFPERLKEGFKVKYLQLKQQLAGDALFMAMFDFAKGGTDDFKLQAASLAILCHLFHLCEVFEK